MSINTGNVQSYCATCLLKGSNVNTIYFLEFKTNKQKKISLATVLECIMFDLHILSSPALLLIPILAPLSFISSLFSLLTHTCLVFHTVGLKFSPHLP